MKENLIPQIQSEKWISHIQFSGDDYVARLTAAELDLLRAMGSPLHPVAAPHEFRSSLTLIARKVAGQWCHIAAEYRASGLGPAQVDVGIAEMAGEQC